MSLRELIRDASHEHTYQVDSKDEYAPTSQLHNGADNTIRFNLTYPARYQ